MILISLCLIAVAGLVTTCSAGNSLIGKWQERQTGQTIEFFGDGRVVLDTGIVVITGEYELIGDEYVKVEFEGLAGALISAFGAGTWRYQVKGDSLTLELAGQAATFRRIK